MAHYYNVFDHEENKVKVFRCPDYLTRQLSRLNLFRFGFDVYPKGFPQFELKKDGKYQLTIITSSDFETGGGI